ncbi:MAG: DUF2294 domain-containing protein [Verrucomicrobia bacterium]|nr:DUF2294 domain-containing protein [Kiritimatiellia bacterium]MCB1079751.1 DUF2294 domain-containing protein [Verrucomicrobiae bacterium]MCP5487304.1 DUF2294 domain-containing protein [Verrucomicrobiota bacterium]
MQSTRGETEAKITQAMVKFEREFMGRGPTEARTYLIDDMVLIRLKGVITRAESHLAGTDPTGRGRDLIKQTRTELLEKARPQLAAMLEDILHIPVRSLHTDISVKTGERIILFTMASAPEIVSPDP